jgi:uncharacterized protein YdeI (YjbR/CyaY-like superfamily)
MNNSSPVFFSTVSMFRIWLNDHSATEMELIVGYWKVGSQRPSMTWSESVDEALCFGWIDGVRKRIDDESYQIRFTPRRPNSIWSAVNISKFLQLQAAGRVTKAGERAFACRTEEKSKVYAYEQPEDAELTPRELKEFRLNKSAWLYFANCPPGYRKTLLHWVASSKKEETRANRLRKLIEACADGKRLR